MEEHKNLHTWQSGEEVFVHPITDIVAKLQEPTITWMGSRMSLDLSNVKGLIFYFSPRAMEFHTPCTKPYNYFKHLYCNN